MQHCQETGYYDDYDEAPEITDAEIHEAYLESLEQTAPATDFASFYALDFHDARTRIRPGYASIGNGLFVRTRRAA